MSKIRIVSDGTLLGTKILDADGQLVTNVTRVMISLDANEATTTAWVEFDQVELDVIAEQDDLA